MKNIAKVVGVENAFRALRSELVNVDIMLKAKIEDRKAQGLPVFEEEAMIERLSERIEVMDRQLKRLIEVQ